MKSQVLLMLQAVVPLLLVQVTLLSVNLRLTSAAIQCLDNNNNPVDWFIIYKTPKLTVSKHTTFIEGRGFYYMDAGAKTWSTHSTWDIQGNNALENSLNQVYSQNAINDMYIMYSDQPPGNAKAKIPGSGHAKGVLSFDQQRGFWLIHSAPRFPPINTNGFKWAGNASPNGQMFLCVTFNTQTSLNTIASQLHIIKPLVYDFDVGQSFKTAYPELTKLLSKAQPSKTDEMRNLISNGGINLKSFAKFITFGRDLYACLVAAWLPFDLYVETWQRKGKLPSSCKTKKICASSMKTNVCVWNIKEIKLPPVISQEKNVIFKETKDHSKFAVSESPGNWVCIGDINRDSTQYHRGGGTLCLQDNQVAKTFRDSVSDYEQIASTTAPPG